jgi:hypothetical protein
MSDIEIKALNSLKALNIFSSIRHSTTFKCDRRLSNGSRQEVTIEILDAGPDSGERYRVSAISNDDKIAGGNGTDNVDSAIRLVSWSDLD